MTQTSNRPATKGQVTHRQGGARCRIAFTRPRRRVGRELSSRLGGRGGHRRGRAGTRSLSTLGAVPRPHQQSAGVPEGPAPLMRQTASHPVETVPLGGNQRQSRSQCCRRDTKRCHPVLRRADRPAALRDQGVAGSNPVSPTWKAPERRENSCRFGAFLFYRQQTVQRMCMALPGTGLSARSGASQVPGIHGDARSDSRWSRALFGFWRAIGAPFKERPSRSKGKGYVRPCCCG